MDKNIIKERYYREAKKCNSYQEIIDYSLDYLYKNIRVAPEEVREIIVGLEEKIKEQGDHVSMAKCLYYKAWTYIDKGEYLSGINELSNSYTISKQNNDIDGTIRSLNTLGLCHTYVGNLSKAFEHFNEALQIASDNNKQNLLSVIMGTIGESLMEIKQHEEALKYSLKAIDIGDPMNRAVNISRVGHIYHLMGDNEKGLEYLNDALKVAEEEKLNSVIPEFLFYLGSVYRGLGQNDRAEETLQLAINRSREEELPVTEARASLVMGEICRTQGRDNEALEYLQAANRIAKENKSASIEVDTLEIISKIYKDNEQWKEAYINQHEYHLKSKELFGKEAARQIDSFKMSMATSEAEYYQNMYEQISTISNIGKDIASSLDLEKIVRITYDKIKEILDVQVFGLGFHDQEKKEISYRFFIEEDKWVEPFALSVENSDSFGAWCINNEKEVVINDVANEYSKYINVISGTDLADKTKFNSLMYIPLKVGEKTIGLLSVQSHRKDAYADFQIEIIRALGSYISIAVENGRLYEEVQSLANKDYLTGSMNRAYFHTLAEREVLKYKRYEKEFCLIMFDLDNFEAINDDYGHDAGDIVLQEVAKLCNAEIREVDLFGRYGGEEFLILLPSTDLDGGILLAERLREGIRELNIAISENKVISISASFGVTMIKPGDENMEDVFKRADKAMYKSKKKGKDRTETCL